MAIGEWSFPTTTYAGNTATFTIQPALTGLFPMVSATSSPMTYHHETEEPKALTFDERTPRGDISWRVVANSVSNEALQHAGDPEAVLQATARMALDKFYQAYENQDCTVWDEQLKLIKWVDEEHQMVVIQVQAPVLKR